MNCDFFKFSFFVMLVLLFACSSNGNRSNENNFDSSQPGDTSVDRDTNDTNSINNGTDTTNNYGTGTNQQDTSVDTGFSTATEGVDTGVEPGGPSNWVFDENSIRVYSFTLAPSDLQHLHNNGIDKEYVVASLDVDGQKWDNVGLRLKGSYSLDSCWNRGQRLWDCHCQKISMQVKFTEYDDSLRFHGLKRINLHAMGADPTKLRERLAYHLFANMDMPAPRSVPVLVRLNGEDWGIYQAVERIDGRFTKNRYPSAGDGNLYKEIWPDGNADWERSFEALKTNDNPEDNPDVSDFLDFARAMSGLNTSNASSVLNTYVDVNQLLRYIAVDRAINNWDGIMAFYWGANHNYYWYHVENGKWILVPWDMDKTFFEYDRYFDPNPAEGIATPVPEWNVRPARCDETDFFGGTSMYAINESIGPPCEGPGRLNFVAPGCDPLINTMAALYWNDFVSIGNNFINTLFTIEYLNARINEWENQLDGVMQSERTISYQEWKSNIAAMKNNFIKQRNDFAAHLLQSYRVE